MTVTVESKQLGKNSVSLKDMYVWGVNSIVTKHSVYFLWKDLSERVAQSCDDTVDKKQVNSCVLKHFFGGSWVTKKIDKKPRKCFVRSATNVTFSKFRDWRHTQKNHTPRGFVKPRVLINLLIQINSGPKILRSCFLQWKESLSERKSGSVMLRVKRRMVRLSSSHTQKNANVSSTSLEWDLHFRGFPTLLGMRSAAKRECHP